jgi:hypothetical protein
MAIRGPHRQTGHSDLAVHIRCSRAGSGAVQKAMDLELDDYAEVHQSHILDAQASLNPSRHIAVSSTGQCRPCRKVSGCLL